MNAIDNRTENLLHFGLKRVKMASYFALEAAHGPGSCKSNVAMTTNIVVIENS